MKRLFIDGPAGGQLDVPEDRDCWKVSGSRPKRHIEFQQISKEEAFAVYGYRKMSFSGHPQTFQLMAAEGMNPDAVIGSLIMGYLKADVGKEIS